MTIDHPHLRRDRKCPLCPLNKDAGTLVCWPCFKKSGMRDETPPHIALHLDRREEFLARQDLIDRQLARFFRL